MAISPYLVNPGIKYIKIARYDANGNDNYVSLRELKKVRIRTNDAGIIEYPVATITEHPTYFLYQTVTTNITSSTNNYIPHQSISASKLTISGYTGGWISPSNGQVQITNLTEVSDPGNNFNELGGFYAPNYTPNVPLILKIRFNYTGSTGTELRAGVFNMYDSFDTGSGALASFTTPPIADTQSGSFSGSINIYPIEERGVVGYTSWMSVSCSLSNSSANRLIINNFEFEISQSIAFQAGIGAQTILEPYITTPFVNSDYNAIINNASENRLSGEFMDVDYADNPNVPINLLTLVSGSATLAQVQDSNYTTQRVISSRYIGRQLESRKFNIYTDSDTAFGKTPNVSNPTTYFLEFNWLAGLAPDYNGRVYASIKNLVDENGNKVKIVKDDEVSMGLFKQVFGRGGTNVDENTGLLQTSSPLGTIKLTDTEAYGNNMASLNKLVYIDKVGKSPRPIIYSQVPSGSAYGYTGSISFIDGDQPDTTTLDTVNDYTMKALAYGSPSTPDYYNILSVTSNGSNIPSTIAPGPLTGIPYEVQFNAPIYLGQSASFATSSGTPSTGSRYKPTGSLANLTGSYVLGHRIALDVGYSNFISQTNNQVKIIRFDFYLQKSTDNGANWNNLNFKVQGQYGTQDTLNWDNTDFWYNAQYASLQLFAGTLRFFIKIYYRETQATTGSLYRILVREDDPGDLNLRGNGSAYIFANTSTWQVSQFPSPPGKGNVGYYWVTGSRPNILHAQRGFSSFGNLRGLNDVYGQRQVDIKRNDSLYFLPIIEDFELQPNDEIRFENLESQTYVITQVSQSVITTPVAGTYNALTLVLNQDIPSTVNINYFLVRRWVDDAYIILGTDKPAGQTSTGVLIPEYVTDKTKEVINNILPTPST